MVLDTKRTALARIQSCNVARPSTSGQGADGPQGLSVQSSQGGLAPPVVCQPYQQFKLSIC